jgi:hypothetical protein
MSNAVFNPAGPGQIILGNPDTVSGGFTSVITSISDEKDGFGAVQCIRASGAAWGELRLNPDGGQVTLPATTILTNLQVAPPGAKTVDIVIDTNTGQLYRQS